MRRILTISILLIPVLALAQNTELKSVIISSGASKTESSNYAIKPSIGFAVSGSRVSSSFGVRPYYLSFSPSVTSPPPDVSSDPSNPTTFPDNTTETTLSVQITTEYALNSVSFYSRKLRDGGDFLSSNADSVSQSSETRTYSYTVSSNDRDELGLVYYFEVRDEAGNVVDSPNGYLYTSVSSNPSISGFSFGGQPQNWRMFSVPYRIESRQISQIFVAYGTYDNTKWRLVRWNAVKKDFDEFSSFSSIDEGKGYWFNAIESKSISITNAVAPDVTDGSPKTITLQNGWNQIGNPYPFDVSWSDILSANGDPTDVSSSLKVFANGTSLQQSDNLSAWGGAYVEYTGSGTSELDVPFRTLSGARTKRVKRITNPLDDQYWEVFIDLSSGIYSNEISRIGMNPEASDGKDRLDERRVPRLAGYLDLNFNIDRKPHSASMRSPKEFETWDFTIENNLETKWVQLTWDNSYFGKNEYQLILHDLENERLIDMRAENTYSFKNDPIREFRIYYGTPEILEESIQPSHSFLGQVYPNPFTSRLIVNYTLGSQLQPQRVDISIYNTLGKKLQTLVNEITGSGFFQQELVTDNLQPGMYLIKMTVQSEGKNGSIVSTRRIIKN